MSCRQKDREWKRVVRKDGTIKMPKRVLPYFAGRKVYIVSEPDSILVCNVKPPEDYLGSKSLLWNRIGEYMPTKVSNSGHLFIPPKYLARTGIGRQTVIISIADWKEGLEVLNPQYLEEYRRQHEHDFPELWEKLAR